MTWWSNRNLHPKTKSKFVVVFGTQMFLPSVKAITKPKIEFETKEFKLLNHKFNYPGNGTWQPIDIKFVDMNGLADNLKTFDTSAFLWQIMNNTGYAYPYMDEDSTLSKNPYYKKVNKAGEIVIGNGHHIATKISSGFRTITTPEKSSTIANSFGGGLSGEIDNTSAASARQKISIFQISPEHPDDDGGEDNEKMKDGIISEAWHLVNPIVKSINWGELTYDSDELVEYSMTVVYDWAIFDRESIGKRLSAIGYDPKQFNSFSGMWAAAGEELKRQKILKSQAFKDVKSDFDQKKKHSIPIVEIDGEKFLDLNADGKISDEEKVLSNPERVAEVEAERKRAEKSKAEADALLAEIEEKTQKKREEKARQEQIKKIQEKHKEETTDIDFTEEETEFEQELAAQILLNQIRERDKAINEGTALPPVQDTPTPPQYPTDTISTEPRQNNQDTEEED